MVVTELDRDASRELGEVAVRRKSDVSEGFNLADIATATTSTSQRIWWQWAIARVTGDCSHRGTSEVCCSAREWWK